MGLLKAGIGALSGALADQWREYFYCEAMDIDILVSKGQKRTSKRSSNTKGEENIISNGSIVAVNEGQCMIIVDQGQVVDFSAEAGEYVYDTSSEPSMLYGGFGKGILETFKTIGKRFTMGGDTGKDQRVYFFNTKEIVGNKYGTPNAVPFRVVDKNIGLDIDIAIRCHGEFSYKITDPLLFYKNVCGNVASVYRRSEIDSMLKTELMTALQPAFAKISDMGIRYSALPGHTIEITDALNDVLSQKWGELRGIQVASFGISSLKASEEDENLIKQLQRNAVMRDPSMAAATLVGAQDEAMRNAAKNSGGAFLGFAGLNAAASAGGMNASNLFAMAQQQQAQQAQQPAPAPEAPAAPAAPAADEWKCPECSTMNTGRFCKECGAKKPEADPDDGSWLCSCGARNKGKFCTECGKKKPAGVPQYKCDKCGWEPEDKTKPPKFCPECGDPFDNDDIVE